MMIGNFSNWLETRNDLKQKAAKSYCHFFSSKNLARCVKYLWFCVKKIRKNGRSNEKHKKLKKKSLH